MGSGESSPRSPIKAIPKKREKSPSSRKSRRSASPSASRRKRSPSPARKRSASPARKESSHKRSASPEKRRRSPSPRSSSKRKDSRSPRKRSASPKKKSSSSNKRSPSPRKKSSSKRSPSPRRKRSPSPRRRSRSPRRRRSPSPKRRSRSRSRSPRKKSSRRSRSRDRRRSRSRSPRRSRRHSRSRSSSPKRDKKPSAFALGENLPARRLRVGNLPLGVGLKAEHLGEFFDGAMLVAGFTNLEKCTGDIWISPDGSFAFVVFSTEAEASMCMLLNGIDFIGSALMISRPPDFKPGGPMQPGFSTAPSGFTAAAPVLFPNPAITSIPPPLGSMILPPALPPVGVAAITGSKSIKDLLQSTRRARRLHVGNLPPVSGLSGPILANFFDSALTALNLNTRPGKTVLDTTIAPGSKFAFVEFRSIVECTNALALNGIELQGFALKVERPKDFSPLTQDQERALISTGLLGIPGEVISGVANPTPPTAGEKTSLPNRFLSLENVLTEEDLADTEECIQVGLDTRDKCCKDYGKVNQIVVCHTGPHKGLILIEFDLTLDAFAAAKGLSGFMFGTSPVKVESLSEERFKELKGDLPSIAGGPAAHVLSSD